MFKNYSLVLEKDLNINTQTAGLGTERYVISGSDGITYIRKASFGEALNVLEMLNNNQMGMPDTFPKQTYYLQKVDSKLQDAWEMIFDTFEFMAVLIFTLMVIAVTYGISFILYSYIVKYFPYEYKWVVPIILSPIPFLAAFWAYRSKNIMAPSMYMEEYVKKENKQYITRIFSRHILAFGFGLLVWIWFFE